MKKLIINADDFGYTPGVTHGILSAHLNGVITSTTALTVSNHFEDAMELAKSFPTLKIGVHLTLTLNQGRPILGDQVPSLIQEDGTFWNQSVFLDKIDLEDVEKEWFAQMERFYATGCVPTHIDSHHGVHSKSKELLKICLKIARHYNLPVRNCDRNEIAADWVVLYDDVKTTDEIVDTFYGENSNEKHFKEIVDYIADSKNEVFEMNCHPAFLDLELASSSAYSNQRLEEYRIMTAKETKELLKNNNIKRISFEDL